MPQRNFAAEYSFRIMSTAVTGITLLVIKGSRC